ncbi:MAG: hypothetical protein WAK95_06890 [Desulfobacterales bacterium]
MKMSDELIRILSGPAMSARHAEAKAAHTCKICARAADGFRDAASVFEYAVSAICQDCQDKYLYAATRRSN